MKMRIIIFAKAPLAGFAKTRLIPALGKAGAAELAKKMLLHTLQAAIAADIGSVELCVTPSIQDIAWNDVELPDGINITEQGSGDLGERMARATQRNIEQGEAVLLIGTDCVEMSEELLRNAVSDLREHDAVIHCTADGGYALLGCKHFNVLLFADMPWSTDQVATMTINRIGRLGWSLQVGRLLHDVDEPQDLQHLPEHWRSYAVA
jgi:rSAM/selenodomain-associated transferase 1